MQFFPHKISNAIRGDLPSDPNRLFFFNICSWTVHVETFVFYHNIAAMRLAFLKYIHCGQKITSDVACNVSTGAT